MSPSAIGGRCSAASDLWALGATLSYLGTGVKPWAHITDRDLRNPFALMFYIANPATAGGHHPLVPSNLSANAVHFFSLLFGSEGDADDMLSCGVLLSHPFITNGGPTITESNFDKHTV